MVGLPVIVTLFADRNGDGFIGPTGKDPQRDVRALAELEPIGTEVALFDGNGRAERYDRGRRSADGRAAAASPSSRPPSAFTGAYDPSILQRRGPDRSRHHDGAAVSSRARSGAASSPTSGRSTVNGTLNPRPRAAALPDPKGALPLALSAKSASPTTDIARAVAGPAVCARVVEPARAAAASRPSRRRWRSAPSAAPRARSSWWSPSTASATRPIRARA